MSDVSLRPRTVAEVQEAVRQARAKRTTLYPVSTNRNWGYVESGALPAGTQLMDMSDMRCIRNADQISPSNPVALVEPGVTQWQLYEFLQKQCPSLTFNVTGSARETSLIGNALDRGVGYLGPRRDDLFGLEVVTGTGQILKTGFRRLGEDSPLAHSHPNGLGPMLDGLFFQGNFGIVTSACFRLIPRPEYQLAVSLALRSEAELPQFIDVLASLKRERLMSSVTHIGNKARTRASLQYGMSSYLEQQCGLQGADLELAVARALSTVAPHEWTSLGGLSGTRGQVAAALSEVKSRLRGLARVSSFDQARLDLGFNLLNRFRRWPWARANAAALAAIRPLNGLASGVPTDAAVDNLLWRYGRSDLPAERFSESDCGILFISPALPMDGAMATTVVNGMTALARGHGHELYVTINIETDTSLVAVCNLLYARSDPAAAGQAMRCAEALHAYVRSRSLEVYRARADMMNSVCGAEDPYWQTLSELKRVLDPDGVIAPGRYSLS